MANFVRFDRWHAAGLPPNLNNWPAGRILALFALATVGNGGSLCEGAAARFGLLPATCSAAECAKSRV